MKRIFEEKLISSLKYFCESKFKYKIICVGSLLGVKLRHFNSSFPVGKMRIYVFYEYEGISYGNKTKYDN